MSAREQTDYPGENFVVMTFFSMYAKLFYSSMLVM